MDFFIGKRFIFPFGIIFLVLMVVSFSAIDTLRLQEYDSIRINLSGRQRMLSQKVTKEILLYTAGGVSKDAVLSTVKVFDATLVALKDGGDAPLNLSMTEFEAIPEMENKETKDQLEKVMSSWLTFKQKIESVLENKNASSMNYIIDNNTKLLDEMDAAVLMMQRSAEEKITRLYWVAALAIFASVLIIISTIKKETQRKYMQQIEQTNIRLQEEVTERKQAEQALLESESNFRRSLDESPLAILISKGRGEIIYANRAMLDLYGYSSTEELRSVPFFRRFTADYQVIIQKRWNARERGEFVPGQFELDIVRFNGEIRSVETFTKRILWDGEGKIQIIYNDITERKRMEEQLRHSQVLSSLGQMTAGIAHEVGNPLASIVLYSEVALKSGDAHRTKKDLRVIHTEAKRAGKLIKDLLAYSRKFETKMRRVNLNGVIKKVIDLRQYQEKVHNINMTTDLLNEVLNIKGDASQLTQVFMNLILNAEEALKDRGGNIKVSSEVDHEWVKVSIIDDGPGIPNQHLDQIFLPFFTTGEIGRGTGLGLSTCYGIITAHGGTVTAENNENGGATFTVTIPLLGKGGQEP